MMKNPYIKVDEKLIELYTQENKAYHFKINMKEEGDTNIGYIANQIRNSLSYTGYSDEEICDMLIKYLYGKESENKEALWFCYGYIIVDNLRRNIGEKRTKIIQCVDCGEWFEVDISSKKIRCEQCSILERKRIKRENYLKNKKLVPVDDC